MALEHKKQIEENIEKQSLEPDGALDLLRQRRFSLEKFKRFLQTVEEYYEAIKDTSTIDRSTAGQLQMFHALLVANIEYHRKKETDTRLQEQLQNAYRDYFALLEKIYWT